MASSFLRFVVGFLALISLSFAITFSVNKYVKAQDAEKQAVAAVAAMLEEN